MKRWKYAVLVSVMGIGLSAQAAFVDWQMGQKQFEGVTLAEKGHVNIDGQVVDLSRLGHGLREKPTIVGRVRVTVAELFASAPDKFIRSESEALSSLLQSRVVTMRQTFLRNVSGSQIEGAFVDALKKNAAILKAEGLSVTQPPLSEFLATVAENGDTATGKTMIFTVVQGDTEALLVYENAVGDTYNFKGPAGLGRAMFSIYFGEMADEGLKDLRNSLLKGE